jgi:hypothetical protein
VCFFQVVFEILFFSFSVFILFCFLAAVVVVWGKGEEDLVGGLDCGFWDLGMWRWLMEFGIGMVMEWICHTCLEMRKKGLDMWIFETISKLL